MERIKIPGKRTGLIYPRIDRSQLMFADYAQALPPPPSTMSTIDWVTALKGKYGMLGNDDAGDCVEAGAYHGVQRRTTYAGAPFTPTTAEAIQLYSTLTGYIPGDESTDNGTDPSQLFTYWQKNGISGHKIVASAMVDFANKTQMMQSIDLFGGAFLALALPVAAQSPVTGLNGNPCWSMELPGINGANGVPGGWGGHFIDVGQYGVDAKGNFGYQAVTWGQLYDMTQAFVTTFGVAAWIVVTEDWIEKNGTSPSGFDLNALLADQKLLAQSQAIK
jgi:hypothetical protein